MYPQHNFTLVNGDTDSISFCKENQGPISKEEHDLLLEELNSLFPEKIRWMPDGYFKTVLVLKAKNYVLEDFNGKRKIKGSALKATMKEKGLQMYIGEVTELLMKDKKEEVVPLYESYCREILNLTDITDWCSKKTITKAVLNPTRTNEQKIADALVGKDVQEGDKIWTYFDKDQKIKLMEDWKNDHCPYTLITKLYKTQMIFEEVIDKKIFINYGLRTKRKLLDCNA